MGITIPTYKVVDHATGEPVIIDDDQFQTDIWCEAERVATSRTRATHRLHSIEPVR